MAKPFTAETKAAIRHLVVEKGIRSARVIADRLGLHPFAVRNQVRQILAEMGGGSAAESPQAKVEPVEPEGVKSTKEEGDTLTVECVVHSSGGVVSKEDLFRVCGINPDHWAIKSLEVKAYQTGMKLETKREVTSADDAENGRRVRIIQQAPHVVQLHAVKAKLERVLPRIHLDATEALIDRLRDGARQYVIPPRIARPKSPALAEIDLMDCHFGNLSWEPEAGENDDLRIKESVFANAIDDILDYLDRYQIQEVIFPIGNDLHHVDTLLRTTTAGTVQDTDGRFPKMVEMTAGAVIGGVEKVLSVPTVTRVRLLYLPGNHDRLTSYHLCREIAAWFRLCDIVSVDTVFRTHKYLTYGKCLFGYIHGDKMADGKLKELPTTMAHEQPAMWAASTCREWKTGHKHTSETFTTLSSREFNGTMVRRLRALTGPNAWHFDNLYIGNQRGAEVYLYEPDKGYVGHFVAPARVA